MENLQITTQTKTIRLTGFDTDNELEIQVADEPIWLKKEEVIQMIEFLKLELKKFDGEYRY